MWMILRLQKKFSFADIIFLILSLLGILSLRFYIFYMIALAAVGAFLIGMTDSQKSIFRRLIVLILLGIGLTYLGVLRNAGSELEEFANLERIQRSRGYLAESAESGFGEDVDVSSPTGALSAIPIGLLYLMLAPFPWQISSMRQLITLPEILAWWASLPLLFYGLWYTIKNRLRSAISILIFTLMLTLSYSIFQGNVGTAYRQRTQIQVFLCIFIAVGWTLLKEKKENEKFKRQNIRHRIAA
jgi:hypothetical protein